MESPLLDTWLKFIDTNKDRGCNYMNLLQKAMDDLYELAVLWRDFSYSVHGRECRQWTGEDCVVWCYFSDSNDHAAVTLRYRGNEIQVAFFNPEKIGGLNRHSHKILDKLIAECTNFLQIEKERLNSQSTEEFLRLKDEKIKNLKDRLAELERQ